ncbi:MAG: Na+/H+ antiporter NhaC family protein, partial [Gemmatimonadales bacterium]|nr:Na+/H+ antiporter NhaC family protein [Gemmatimonadales bacterium]
MIRVRLPLLQAVRLGLLAACWSVLSAIPLAAQDPSVTAPDAFLTGIPFTLTVELPGGVEPSEVVLRSADGTVLARDTILPFESATLQNIVLEDKKELPLTVEARGRITEVSKPMLPGWASLVPPLVAIILALVLREVITSLFAGVWLGCMFLAGYNPLNAVLMTISRYASPELAKPDHTAIVIFSLLLGGMVGVLSRMGATTAIVDAVSPLATSRRRGQFATWLLGLAIFFDDYSNTLIVGNTMRPLTDRLKISREKLAYIVDSTAAPVAAMVFVSTWVGFEISLIADSLAIAETQGATAATVSAFGIFINSIPFLFYPILALWLVLVLVVQAREYGPMLAAEQRAAMGQGLYREGAQLAGGDDESAAPATGVVSQWWMGAVAVLTVVVTVVPGLVTPGIRALPEGSAQTLSNIFGAADPFKPLLWGSLLGSIVAILLAVGGRKLSLVNAIHAWAGGLRSMLVAIVILVLAWSLGAVTQSLGTAPFLSSLLSEGLPVMALPMGVFVIAAAISFATGTAWG